MLAIARAMAALFALIGRVWETRSGTPESFTPFERRKTSRENPAVYLLKTFGLFLLTALAEILGCYLPYLWLRQGRTAWLLVPAAASLTLFAWLLTLHPTGAGRVYAAYGGVYVGVAILWLWRVDGVAPTAHDLAGVALCLAGMAVIMLGPRG